MNYQTREELEKLEKKIGYSFQDKSLLECALTHSSYVNEHKINRCQDYERLEFLGDAVLEMVSSTVLYKKYPEKKEGELSKLRSTLVCEPALAYCARDIGLEAFIRLGKGEEATGGRQRDSIISDVMEATIGAMYLDSGRVEEAQDFIMKFILSDLENKRLFYDAKSILQEKIQQQGQTIRYEVLEECGPEHCKVFRVAVLIDDEQVQNGEGRSKKAAEQQAAHRLLLEMNQ